MVKVRLWNMAKKQKRSTLIRLSKSQENGRLFLRILQTETTVIDDHQLVIRCRHRHNWPGNTEQLQLDASDGEDTHHTLVSCCSQPVFTETDHLHT